jgi:hypothetical protein
VKIYKYFSQREKFPDILEVIIDEVYNDFARKVPCGAKIDFAGGA